MLKVADFGCADYYCGDKLYEYVKGTFMYHPPEKLIKYGHFALPVDMWSLGCILNDLLQTGSLFMGYDETNQLELITGYCGSINLQWPEVSEHVARFYPSLPKNYQRLVRERFGSFTSDSFILELLDKLLEVNPSRRWSCRAALTFMKKNYLDETTELQLAKDSNWS